MKLFDTSFGLKTWIYPGLIWGMCMYLIMTIILPLLEEEPITRKKMIVGLPIWLIGGLVLEYFQYKRLDKKSLR